MSYLIVVAHPDDEVLGAGATIHLLSSLGKEVNVCIMSGAADARTRKPTDDLLKADMNASLDSLGVRKRYIGQFPNIQMNTVPHLELVKFIEASIVDCNADTIITHHPGDLNDDHVQTSRACVAAARLFQRRSDIRPLKELLYMEVPSATDWGFPPEGGAFKPNTYIEIGQTSLCKKIDALSCYRDVMRDYPHPRSAESIRGLAAIRGSQSGCSYAEAFESIFKRLIF